MTAEELNNLYTRMFQKIDGESNPDVDWYMNKRPETITRDSFFKSTVWAIWVAGLSREAADSFLERAERAGFDWDFKTISSWDDQRIGHFVNLLHGSTHTQGRPRKRPVPKRALQKWEAVRQVAKLIGQFPDEHDFREQFFGGKVQSATLDKSDIRRLVGKNMPFVRQPNAAFIVRNMGGEAIKCDRWVGEFLRYYGLRQTQLETLLQQAEIPFGLFDIVLWAYCERFVGKVSNFRDHFNNACT